MIGEIGSTLTAETGNTLTAETMTKEGGTGTIETETGIDMQESLHQGAGPLACRLMFSRSHVDHAKPAVCRLLGRG